MKTQKVVADNEGTDEHSGDEAQCHGRSTESLLLVAKEMCAAGDAERRETMQTCNGKVGGGRSQCSTPYVMDSRCEGIESWWHRRFTSTEVYLYWK